MIDRSINTYSNNFIVSEDFIDRSANVLKSKVKEISEVVKVLIATHPVNAKVALL